MVVVIYIVCVLCVLLCVILDFENFETSNNYFAVKIYLWHITRLQRQNDGLTSGFSEYVQNSHASV
jgi:hypothetical protein